MKPVSPVVPGRPGLEVVIAKGQQEYIPLPAVISDGFVTSRWRLSWRERLGVLLTGDLWLTLHTFGRPLQPIRCGVDLPEWLRG